MPVRGRRVSVIRRCREDVGKMSDGSEGDCMAFPFSALPSDTTVCGEDIRPSVTKRRVAVRDRKDRSVLFPKPCIPFRGFRDLPKFLCRAGFLCPVPADNRTAFSSFSRTAAFAVFGRFCCRSAAADSGFYFVFFPSSISSSNRSAIRRMSYCDRSIPFTWAE